MIEAFTAPNAGEDFHLLFVAIRWNQSHDRRADHFLGSVSEDAFRPEIPTGDDTVQVLSDDGVVGGSHDGCQLASSDFRQMALGHVAVAPDATRIFPLNCQDFGMTLQDSPIF